MKSGTKKLMLFTSVAIIFTYFVVGLYTSTAYANCIELNSDMSKYKVQKRTKDQNKNQLASLEGPEIIEEDIRLEDWMFNIRHYSIKTEELNQIESWMLDRAFWMIYDPNIINEELIEEEPDIEDWMINFCPINCSSSGIYTNYLEKEWMENHRFLIL